MIAGPRGRLEVELTGPDDGRALIFHTGTPGHGSIFPPLGELGSERGIRHIAYSRPGYGESERCAGRSIADCAQDVAALADAIGVGRFYTVGRSGGGPHALACAALLPERVIAAATIAGVAPPSAEGLDWLAGMGQDNVEEFGAARAGEQQLRDYLTEQRAQMVSASAADMHEALGDLLSSADRSVLTGDYAEYLSENTRAGLRHGVDGWLDDDEAIIVRPWGFDLGSISRAVTIWQGDQDRMVPLAHGEWLAAHVPGAQTRLLPGHGHLSLALSDYGALLDDLLARGD
jgi:pimeloyl-ACP methyl ester carboxylesterase